MKTKLGLVSLFLFVFLTHCQKDAYTPLPHVDVNIQILPNSIQYLDLNAVGGFIYLTANYPSRGIIVYRLGPNDFKAYERTCPYDPDGCCSGSSCSRLVVEENRLSIIDSCCNSVYLILDGSNISGPSTYPLKQYHTSYDGTTLRIYD
jgi:nitrite reductase/ring-hydroxylating ferredoxin subunit